MTKLTGLNSGAKEALLAAKWGDAKKTGCEQKIAIF